jgi:hypothetical protein
VAQGWLKVLLVTLTGLSPAAHAQSATSIDWHAVISSGADPHIELMPLACIAGDPCIHVSGVSTSDGQPAETYGFPEYERITYGDLTGDGQTEALIPLNSGGTAGLSGALIYRLGGDAPQLVYAGGDVGGAAAYIDPNAHLVFTLFKVGLPTCCPTAMLIQSFKLVGNSLVKQQECRYTPQGDYGILRPPCTTFGTGAPSASNTAAGPSPQAVAPDAQTPVAADDDTSSSAATDSDQSAPPATLTDGVRADIQRAITRANNAWARANEFLDVSTLNGNVAGQALTDDQRKVADLRAQGHAERDHESAFTISDLAVDAPGHAVVHTHETWYAETYDAADRNLLQHIPASSYNETYIVEFQNGGWIVTRNDVN